jgi:hypothetical protein
MIMYEIKHSKEQQQKAKEANKVSAAVNHARQSLEF